MIPPSRPVFLVLDGHGSHITIDVIEYARANEIHMLHVLAVSYVPCFTAFGCGGL